MSSNPLVSDAMLRRVRTLGARTLTVRVTILERSVEENDYGDGEEVFADAGDYDARIRQMNNPDLAPGIGLISDAGSFRIHLEPTVSLRESDRVADAHGNIYVVNNSNSEDTIRVFTTAMCQKLQ